MSYVYLRIMVKGTKIETQGEEMIIKTVKRCGNTGRIYLPVGWVGKKVRVMNKLE